MTPSPALLAAIDHLSRGAVAQGYAGGPDASQCAEAVAEIETMAALVGAQAELTERLTALWGEMHARPRHQTAVRILNRLARMFLLFAVLFTVLWTVLFAVVDVLRWPG